MLELQGLQQEFLGKRVMVVGKRIVTCSYCHRHLVAYGACTYHYQRDRQRHSCPALKLVCPDCHLGVVMPIPMSVAGRISALEVDDDDLQRLRHCGWLPR